MQIIIRNYFNSRTLSLFDGSLLFDNWKTFSQKGYGPEWLPSRLSNTKYIHWKKNRRSWTNPLLMLLSAKIPSVLCSLSAEERQTFKHFDAEVMCIFSIFASLANTSVGDWIWRLYLIYCDHRVSYKSHFKNIEILYFPEKKFSKNTKGCMNR